MRWLLLLALLGCRDDTIPPKQQPLLACWTDCVNRCTVDHSWDFCREACSHSCDDHRRE